RGAGTTSLRDVQAKRFAPLSEKDASRLSIPALREFRISASLQYEKQGISASLQFPIRATRE
ncbi:hypothetical protein, partial [Streptomyces hypolithicus]